MESCILKTDEAFKVAQAETGSENGARRMYLENDNKWPQHIIDTAARNMKLGISAVETSDTISDVQLDKKKKIVRKATVVMNKKINRLSRSVKKTPKIEKSIKDLEALVKKMERFKVDKALVEFAKSSKSMTDSALHYLNEMQAGNIPKNLNTLNKIKDSMDSFELIKDVQVEFIEDENLKEEAAVIGEAIQNMARINTMYTDMSRELLVEKMLPGFDKIEAAYRLDAEKEWNRRGKEMYSDKLSAKEVAAEKKKYIEDYIGQNRGEIEIESKRYLTNLLTSSPRDINLLESWFVNPRDINNDTVAFAVELLDEADYRVMRETINERNTASELFERLQNEFGKETDMKKQYAPMLELDRNGELSGRLVNKVSSPGQYKAIKEGKYAGTIVEEVYDFLIDNQTRRDEMVPGFAKLGFDIAGMNKSAVERIAENGLGATMTGSFRDAFRLQENDTDLGDIKDRLEAQKDSKTIEVITDEQGRERQVIPIHYRHKMEMADKSLDLLSIAVIDFNNTNNYRSKSEVAVTLEALSESVAASQIQQRTLGKHLLKIDKNSNEEAVEHSGRDSNLMQNLQDLVEHRIYGVSMKGDPGNVKLAKQAKSYVSYLNLSFNYLAAGANLMQGTAMSWIETAGGETGRFGAKNRLKGTKKYNSDIANITKDIGGVRPKSRTNVIAEHLNAFADWNASDIKFVKNNRAKRLTNGGAMFALSQAGEHGVQSIAMYSVLDNIKVKNSKGEYINKEGKVVKREEAMSIDEAMVVENGKISFVKGAHSTDATTGLGTNDMQKISKLVQATNRRMYGNYDSQNKSRVERTIMGSYAMHMRGWLVPGLQARYRGMAKVGTEYSKLDIEQRYFNRQTGQFEEGMYTTTVRLLNEVRKDFGAMKLLSFPENWNELTDYEKGNVKKTVLEASLIAGALILSGLAEAAVDDDDDQLALHTAFFARRLYSELFTFANPNETHRTLRSPAIALSTTEKIMDLILQTTSPTEIYDTGKRKNQYKIRKRIEDLIPLVNKLDTDVQQNLNFQKK